MSKRLDQLKLIMHINNINVRENKDIILDLRHWEELGVTTINEFEDYRNFDQQRQMDMFAEEDMENLIAYHNHLEMQAAEFDYYRANE